MIGIYKLDHSSRVFLFMLRSCFSSIRIRLILLVLLAVVPALGLIFYTAVEERRLAANAAQKEALRLAHLVAEDHRELIEETKGLLIAMAQVPSVRNHNSAQCNGFFKALLEHYHDHYTNLAVFGRDGNMFCSAIPLTQAPNAAHEPWFRQAMQSHSFALSEYRIGRISGKAQVSLTYPVLNDEGRAQAIVLTGLDLARVNRLAAKTRLPQNSTATLIDHNGIILARYPDLEKLVGQSFSSVPLFRTAMTKQSEGNAESADLDGISRLYAFTHLGVDPRQMDVSVIVGIPKDVVLEQANRTLKRNVILLGLVGLLAMAVAWFGGNLSIVTPVSALVLATKRLAAGDLNVRTGPSYHEGELGELQHAFDEMAETLQMRQADAKRAEEELRGSHEQLRALAAHLQSVREEERTEMAREIHDELGQTLTGLKMDIAWLGKKLDENQNSLREKTKSVLDVVDGTIQTVRRLSTELRPSVLDNLGLAAAIEWQIHQFQNRTGIKCEFSLPREEIHIDGSRSTAMFRILQETLTNIARHADATEVEITLEQEDGNVLLQVTDNGRGISEGKLSDPKSLGLLGMRERVLLTGGEFSIRRNGGEGTTVIVRIPLSKSE